MYAHCACMLSCFSRVWLFVTLWTGAHQVPLSMEMLQARILEKLSPFPRNLPNPGIKPRSPQLSHKGSPRILEWVAFVFSSRYSLPSNRTGFSCIAGGFYTNWVIREALLLGLSLIPILPKEVCVGTTARSGWMGTLIVSTYSWGFLLLSDDSVLQDSCRRLSHHSCSVLINQTVCSLIWLKSSKIMGKKNSLVTCLNCWDKHFTHMK